MKRSKRALGMFVVLCMMVSVVAGFTVGVSAAPTEMTSYTPKPYEPALGTFIAGRTFGEGDDTVAAWNSHVLYKNTINQQKLVVGFTVSIPTNSNVKLGFNNKQYAIGIGQHSSGAVSIRMYNLSKDVYDYDSAKKEVTAQSNEAYSQIAYVSGELSGTTPGVYHSYSFEFKKGTDGVKLEKVYFDGTLLTLQKNASYENVAEGRPDYSQMFSAADLPFSSNVDWKGKNVTQDGGAVSITKGSGTTTFTEAYVYAPKAIGSVDTLVSIPSYLPQAGQIYVDDNFEDGTVDIAPSVGRTIPYPADAYGIGSTSSNDRFRVTQTADGTNKYLAANNWGTGVGYKGRSDADEMVVYFKAMRRSGSTSYGNINIGKTAPLYFSLYGTGFNVTYNTSLPVTEQNGDNVSDRYTAGSKDTTAFSTSQINNVHEIACDFKREKQTDGSYKVHLMGLWVDGTKIAIKDIDETTEWNMDWWSIDSTFLCYLGGNCNTLDFDDILVYSPATEAEPAEPEFTCAVPTITSFETPSDGTITGSAYTTVTNTTEKSVDVTLLMAVYECESVSQTSVSQPMLYYIKPVKVSVPSGAKDQKIQGDISIQNAALNKAYNLKVYVWDMENGIKPISNSKSYVSGSNDIDA